MFRGIFYRIEFEVIIVKKFDKIIIGAGIYGLYSAYFCAKKGEKILLLEYDNQAVSRATYINQARVHNGYHYPRSYSTAIKSSKYFSRFNEDFNFSINKKFRKILHRSKRNFSRREIVYSLGKRAKQSGCHI